MYVDLQHELYRSTSMFLLSLHFCRALQMTLQTSGDLATLSHLALCAGFDAVARTSDGYVEAYVSNQAGTASISSAVQHNVKHIVCQ